MRLKLKQCGVVVLSLVLCPVFADAAVVADFTASAAGAGVEPNEVSPAWTLESAAMANDGSALVQNNIGTAYGRYYSPTVAGLMDPTGEYGIELRVKPLTDMSDFLHGSDHANIAVFWQDNGGGATNAYNISFDLDEDDAGAGSVGTLRYGTGSYSDAADVAVSGTQLAAGIDWSTSHTIFIGYKQQIGAAGDGVFDIYIDGVLNATLQRGWMWRNIGANVTVDGAMFGDNTANGQASQAEWEFVRLHDTSAPIPEPAAFALVGAGLLLVCGRKRAVC